MSLPQTLGRLLQGKGPDISIEPLEKFLTSTPQGPHKLALIPSQEAKRLLAMIATNNVHCRGASLRWLLRRGFTSSRRPRSGCHLSKARARLEAATICRQSAARRKRPRSRCRRPLYRLDHLEHG